MPAFLNMAKKAMSVLTSRMSEGAHRAMLSCAWFFYGWAQWEGAIPTGSFGPVCQPVVAQPPF